MGKLSLDLTFPDKVTRDHLISNKANCHHASHQRFANLECVKARLSKENSSNEITALDSKY